MTKMFQEQNMQLEYMHLFSYSQNMIPRLLRYISSINHTEQPSFLEFLPVPKPLESFREQSPKTVDVCLNVKSSKISGLCRQCKSSVLLTSWKVTADGTTSHQQGVNRFFSLVKLSAPTMQTCCRKVQSDPVKPCSTLFCQ